MRWCICIFICLFLLLSFPAFWILIFDFGFDFDFVLLSWIHIQSTLDFECHPVTASAILGSDFK